MPVVDLFSEKKVQKICTKFGKKEARKNGTQPTVYSRHSGPKHKSCTFTPNHHFVAILS